MVTSIRGAAIKEFVSVGRRRYPGVRFVWPIPVQGEGAEVNCRRHIAQPFPSWTIIVGRGGGSQEDLFVQPLVSWRGPYASRVPVASAVATNVTLP